MGRPLAGARGVSDLLLERNQAFRAALLDLQHVTTLLGYTAGLARTRGDEPLAAWHEGWGARLRVLEDRGRAAAAAMGADPEDAIAPADDGRVGRAGAQPGRRRRDVGRGARRISHRPVGSTPLNLREFPQ